MARRTMAGQLNMFDFFSSMEDVSGEVEMVSLMPNFDDDAEPEAVEELETVDESEIAEELESMEEPKPVEELETAEESEPEEREKDEQVAMSRTYEIDGEKIEIAYINYNKVRVIKGKNAPEIMMFASSKEAVDYYVEKMQELESED